MKKILILIANSIIFPCLLLGQSFETRYENLISESKFEEIPQLLLEWEKEEPKNPEMFIANFNFYLQESQQEVLRMDTKPSGGQNFIINDTATGEPVAYLYSEIQYDTILFNKAQNYLIDGIKINPNRLDMYFGRIYSLRESGYLKEHVEEIIKVIRIQATEQPSWLWSDNQELEDSEEMFKSSIQDYGYALFTLEIPYLEGINTISQEMIKYYPNDIENYSNIGACYLMEENWEEALNILELAENIDKKDYIVLGNIAYAYKMKGDIKKAISHYKKVVKYAPNEEKEFAKEQIKMLKKS